MDFPEGLTAVDVMNYSLAAMRTVVTRYRLAGSPPDVLVTIPANDVRSGDFHLADTMISLGRTAAERALGEAGLGNEAM